MAKDLFSSQASLYARYRPDYPAGLYDYLFSLVRSRNAAWDCATGNGQAALALTACFPKVFATDISAAQLQQAIAHPAITYSRAPAENSGLPDHSVDCITVAQAYHWLDAAAFKQEVQRVSRPGAVLAVWGYGLIQCADPAVNEAIAVFYRHVTGPYWDQERKQVDEHYSTITFPYEELPSKDFRIDIRASREWVEGYLNTWSAVQHFIKARGYNPVNGFIAGLSSEWPDDEEKDFYFPVFLRAGRISS